VETISEFVWDSIPRRNELLHVAHTVSGEYPMRKGAATSGMRSYERAMVEVLTSILRGRADAVITCHALDAAEVLRA
jgi:porphobilinogen synthase